jgi:3-hydroxybutyryl-CoA dehydrogenase
VRRKSGQVIKDQAGDLGVKTGKGFYDWSQRDINDVIRKRDEHVVRQLKFLKEIGEL